MRIQPKAGIKGRIQVGNTITEEIVPEAFILVDDYGNEIPAVMVEEEVEVTATVNDIRLGTTAVTGEGVVVGEKEIPLYHTTEGWKLVPGGSNFLLYVPHYEYTKLQAIFCPFNDSVDKSVAAEKVAIEDNIYKVLSSTPEAAIFKDSDNKRIDFGIKNDSGSLYLIRYILYKGVY